MPVRDYLIDHSDFDWSDLLSGWSRLVPAGAAVWLMNRFGDLFLTTPDGAVHMLDVGTGTVTRLADDRDDFSRQLDAGDNADDWLMVPLVDQLVGAGVRLQPGQCYSFVIPPVLGGEYAAENVAVLPIKEHYGVYGSYHDQLRDAPDGARVELRLQRP